MIQRGYAVLFQTLCHGNIKFDPQSIERYTKPRNSSKSKNAQLVTFMASLTFVLECVPGWRLCRITISAVVDQRVFRHNPWARACPIARSRYFVRSMEITNRLVMMTDFNRWTAVVRGAVIFGVEKATNQSTLCMSGCPRSYGVLVRKRYSKVEHDAKDLKRDHALDIDMAQDQLQWLVKKGDLVLSNQDMEVSIGFERNLTRAGAKNGSIEIYAYDDDDLPTRLSDSWNGTKLLAAFTSSILTLAEPGLTRIYTLEYDLGPYPLSQHKLINANGQIYVASLMLKLRLAPGFVRAQLCLQTSDLVISEARIRDRMLDDLISPTLEELVRHYEDEEQEVSDLE
jgi:hypothetical protein